MGGQGQWPLPPLPLTLNLVALNMAWRLAVLGNPHPLFVDPGKSKDREKPF